MDCCLSGFLYAHVLSSLHPGSYSGYLFSLWAASRVILDFPGDSPPDSRSEFVSFPGVSVADSPNFAGFPGDCQSIL